MQIKNKKQVFITALTVLVSASLVVTVVMAITTVGNDVSVGNDLDVANNVIISGDLDVVGDFYATGTVTVVATSPLATTTITDLTVSGTSTLSTIDSGTWKGTEIGVIYGGTGLTSISQGQTLYAPTNNTLAATSTLFLYSNGYVGIATTTPAVELDIYDGLIRAYQTSTTTCSTAIRGSIFFHDGDNHFYGCDGTNWLKLNN